MFPNEPSFLHETNDQRSWSPVTFLHIVTNDVQCDTYLFDPLRHIRIFCALVGTKMYKILP